MAHLFNRILGRVNHQDAAFTKLDSFVFSVFNLKCLLGMQLPQQFPYNPKWHTLLLGAVLFGGGAFFMAYMARHPEEGLRSIPLLLSRDGAESFYWITAVLSGALSLYVLFLIARRFVVTQSLELLQDALVLPRGLFQSGSTRIPYANIDRVWETQRSGQIFLFVATPDRRFTITASFLPDEGTYAAVKDFLVAQQSSR